MFAIALINKKQYLVKPADVILVDRFEGKPDDKLIFSDVLAVWDEKNTEIGTPYVAGKKVTANIVDQVKGDKIQVRRFKSKVRYRRTRGFRAQLTKLEIIDIT